MIVTREFAFVHLHRCGGSFVSAFIERFFPGVLRLGCHLPISQLPRFAAGLPVLGTVRDPWSFYVSYYFSQRDIRRRQMAAHQARSAAAQAAYAAGGADYLNGVDVVFDVGSHEARGGFETTLDRWLVLGSSPVVLDEMLPAMPLHYGQRMPGAVAQREGFCGMNLLRHELASIRDSGAGLYSFLFRRMFGAHPDRVHIVPMENLREQLPRTLDAIGVVVTDEMQDYLARAEVLNRSEREDYRNYYSPRQRELVSIRDRELLSRFGYDFDPPLAWLLNADRTAGLRPVMR